MRKLQVFVSSTYTDLVEERQAAVSAILKAGHIPAGMELFSAGDQSQLDVIKKWIDQSDVYMLILGTRYGSLEPVSKDGYTEVEYDYAVSTGKPYFSLVMGPSALDAKLRETGGKFVEQENPAKLKTFKDKVLGKMCSIYSDSREIRSFVLENLIDFAARDDLEGWVKGGSVIDPNPLYKQISDLTEQVRQLKADLSDARVKQDELAPSPSNQNEFLALSKLLLSQELTVPAEISTTNEEIKRTILTLFIANISNYVRGVTIAASAKPRTKWFEANVYSVLVTHRLLSIASRTASQRLYVITERGIDFAAWIDQTKLEAKNTKSKN
jgi:hypothetical protein